MAERSPDPRSGVDEAGEWRPAFPGQRRPLTAEDGAKPGNELAVRHGAYAVLKLGGRVDELVGELREFVPGYRPADEVMLRLLGVTLARIEAASQALEAAGSDELERLRADLRGWVNSARRLANDLAMSPTARGRLRLDVARTAQSLTATGLAADVEAELEAEREGRG